MDVEAFTIDGAQATLYRTAPAWSDLRAMAVGKFKCQDPGAGAILLRQIATAARADGAAALIGPMDGDTWHSYRLVCESDGRPSFLMEPAGDADDLTSFTDAGFAPISRYFSAAVPLEDIPQAPLANNTTFTVAQWDGHDPEGLFAQVHALSCTAFAKNPFYKPIALSDFLALYMPFVPLLKPELIWFARTPGDELVGFLFGIPNYADGPKSDTAILKTYASLSRGAGHALSSGFHLAASELGYQTAIHALIHEENLSALRSQMNGAQVFRRYALMGRRLGD